jgi:hypothetical protein
MAGFYYAGEEDPVGNDAIGYIGGSNGGRVPPSFFPGDYGLK